MQTGNHHPIIIKAPGLSVSRKNNAITYFLLLSVSLAPNVDFPVEPTSSFNVAETLSQKCDPNPPDEINTSPTKVALPENISGDWWNQVQKSIADAEYEINWQEERKSYSSPNRAQNLRFDYYDNGFLVSPRTEKTWTVQMTSGRGIDERRNVNVSRVWLNCMLVEHQPRAGKKGEMI